MKPDECTLYSGGMAGAEETFGLAAERSGVREVHFSFEGHDVERTRGLRVLDPVELRMGDVSLEYVSRLMNRTYRETPLFKLVLQSIWHQVSNASEVFVVGKILRDGTVKGGTGWGAEFAKLRNKPVFVFDQERDGWFQWRNASWESASDPVIHESRFCGSGTRYLEENGREAIDSLFRRTF